MNVIVIVIVIVIVGSCVCVWIAASWCDHLSNRVGVELPGYLETKVSLVSNESRFQHDIIFIVETETVVVVVS